MSDEKTFVTLSMTGSLSPTYTLGEGVWMAAVQVLQLAMLMQQDVSHVLLGLKVQNTGKGVLDLTQESRDELEAKIQSFVPETALPEQDEEQPVFVISGVKTKDN